LFLADLADHADFYCAKIFTQIKKNLFKSAKSARNKNYTQQKKITAKSKNLAQSKKE